MARLAGKNAILTLATNDLVGLTNWNLNTTADTPETTGMDSSGAKAYIAGNTGWSGGGNGHWDTTQVGFTGATPALAVGTTVACIFELVNDATATDRYTGSAIVTGFNVTAAVEGLIDYTIELQGTGVLTHPTTTS